MQESLNFVYDGQSNKKFGVYLAHVDGGLYNEPFLPTRKIIEKKIANREKPYFQGIEQEPLKFSMTIIVKEWDILENKRQIARWLFQDYYKPLYFESNPERIYYAIIEGDSEIFHNGIREGVQEHAYINLQVRCDSPYAYTPEYPLPNIKFRNSFGQGGKTEIKGSDLLNYMDTVINADFQNGGMVISDGIKNWIDFAKAYPTWSEVDKYETKSIRGKN